jgi:hypothetical protein
MISDVTYVFPASVSVPVIKKPFIINSNSSLLKHPDTQKLSLVAQTLWPDYCWGSHSE